MYLDGLQCWVILAVVIMRHEGYVGTYFQNMGLNAIDAAATVRG